MGNLAAEPLFYILFIYGLSFVVMSVVVIRGVVRATRAALVVAFRVLAAFGLAHGLTEWVDWLRLIQRVRGMPTPAGLTWTSQVLLVLSFVLLLQFGVELLTYKLRARAVLRAVPAVLAAAFLVALLARGITDVQRAGLLGRYAFGFAGAALSAVGLLRLALASRSLGITRLVAGLAVAAVGFALYAVFGGLVVEPLLGLPIQLFRATCAATIAGASFFVLGLFRAEPAHHA